MGSLQLANSVGNKALHKNKKHFASRRKGSSPIRPGSCLDYTSILIFKGEYYPSNGEPGFVIIPKLNMSSEFIKIENLVQTLRLVLFFLNEKKYRRTNLSTKIEQG